MAGTRSDISQLDGLDEFATVRQLEYLAAVREKGSYYAAAKMCGVVPNVVKGSLDLLKRKAAKHRLEPHRLPQEAGKVPDGFAVKGTSTLYDEAGNLKAQWVKTDTDRAQQELLMRQTAEAMAAELPRLAPVKPPQVTTAQLATLYTLTDCHVGMRSWAKETGDDWDLAIAERVLVGCFEQMVKASPPAETGFVNQLGDFLHYDSLLPLTPTSGHVVDADSRYSKMGETAVRILRRVVAMALEKHKRVVLLLAEGNHDLAGSAWLRIMFRALYENEPRVKVIDSEMPYYAYQHGKTMLAFHHGHMKKNDQLPLLFAAQFSRVWGETTRRYCHTGHRHHSEEKEHSGMTVVQHPTLAARDSHASRGGWIADRAVTAITYHVEFGQVARNTVVPEMLA